MFKTRSSKVVKVPGYLVTQPSQAFTVRQIIDQFARGEVIPTAFQATDFLGDEIDDDKLDDIIEFEDAIDAEAHLKENQYRLFEDETIRNSKQESTSEVRKGSDESSDKATD